jgi:hypothetical protein
MTAWQADGNTVLVSHFRERIYVLGGIWFSAVGTISTSWVRVFQYRVKAKQFRKTPEGGFLYRVVIDRMIITTGKLNWIANFKAVYPDMVVEDIDRVIGLVRRKGITVYLATRPLRSVCRLRGLCPRGLFCV